MISDTSGVLPGKADGMRDNPSKYDSDYPHRSGDAGHDGGAW